jgi:hypothetical protein
MAGSSGQACAGSNAGFVIVIALMLGSAAWAQEPAPVPTPLSKACQVGDTAIETEHPLPNVAAALKDRKELRILAIGASSGRRDGRGSYTSQIEKLLEQANKGIDVVIINRGVSGELAADAAERIKTEVALNDTDLVLWQLGTADALAQVPVADFHVAVSETIEWLKEHKVDVILVGLRYTHSMVRDLHYQAVRAAIQDIAKTSNVLRIGRYEAEEVLERIRREQAGPPISEAEVSEASYVCMAEYLARAIAAGLFVREPPSSKPPAKP